MLRAFIMKYMHDGGAWLSIAFRHMPQIHITDICASMLHYDSQCYDGSDVYGEVKLA